MNYGYLNKYFLGFGAKRLSEVEVSSEVSNQHELNGITDFKDIFGTEKLIFSTKYLYLSDSEESVILDSGTLTWYDARENHPTRTEFRLYYTSNDVITKATAGDLIVVCKVSPSELFVIVAPQGSTSERQILWLFGLGEIGNSFIVKDLADHKVEIGFAGNLIISSLGIEVEDTTTDYLEELVEVFGLEFPKTKEFSEFARLKVKGVSPEDEPDKALISWLEFEEMLFRTLEKEIVQIKLKNGFGKDGIDVDEFINFSLSVQNRRKSRAGHAFENHLSVIFDYNKINYSKGIATERNNKPDFIFPGIKQYTDSKYPAELLTMLGVKTSAKDRWRQVLSEADRIQVKHLITLQPAISENQTDEMMAQNLQLVVPSPILPTYSNKQQSSLISLSDFISVVRSRQK